MVPLSKTPHQNSIFYWQNWMREVTINSIFSLHGLRVINRQVQGLLGVKIFVQSVGPPATHLKGL